MKKTSTTLPALPSQLQAVGVIGVIGLGIMGGVMAQELLKKGCPVLGFDIDKSAQKRLQKMGGKPLGSTTEVATQADVLIISLATTTALAHVVAEIAALPKREKTRPLVVLETSTLPISDKERAYEALKKRGITVLDCPISGTADRMKQRAWTVFCSGNKPAYQKTHAIFQVFTDNTPYVGAFGNGTKIKFAANHLVAIYNVAYAETLMLSRKMGLNPQDVLDLFGDSPVIGTGVMRLRAPFMIKREYLPATMKVQVWQKDMQVIGDMARSLNCPTPLFNACAPIYTAAMAQGLALEDTASVHEVLGKMAGISPRSKKKAARSPKPAAS